jgi:hypothetical protein
MNIDTAVSYLLLLPALTLQQSRVTAASSFKLYTALTAVHVLCIIHDTVCKGQQPSPCNQRVCCQVSVSTDKHQQASTASDCRLLYLRCRQWPWTPAYTELPLRHSRESIYVYALQK